MFTGFQDRTKIEYAVEVAATLAYSSVQSRDKVADILFLIMKLIEVGETNQRKITVIS